MDNHEQPREENGTGEKGQCAALERIKMVSDLRILEKSFSQNWNVSQELKSLVIASMEDIILSNPTNTRKRIAASRVILAADANDIRREGHAIRERGDELGAKVQLLRAAMLSDPALTAAVKEQLASLPSE